MITINSHSSKLRISWRQHLTSKEITEIEKLIKTSHQVDDAKYEVLKITQNLFDFGRHMNQLR